MNKLIEKIELVSGIKLDQMKVRSRKQNMCFARTSRSIITNNTASLLPSFIKSLTQNNYLHENRPNTTKANFASN